MSPSYHIKPKNGFVPDKTTAIKIAEAVLIPIYGKEKIENQKPLQAILSDGTWTVFGSLPEGWRGGTATAEISQKDGKIIRVFHGR